MNRDQRRAMSLQEMKGLAETMNAENNAHAERLAREGFAFPPMVRFEVLTTTLADMMFGEGTRKRYEFELAVQERFAQLFSEENVTQMKQDAIEAHARARLTEGVHGIVPDHTRGNGDTPKLIRP